MNLFFHICFEKGQKSFFLLISFYNTCLKIHIKSYALLKQISTLLNLTVFTPNRDPGDSVAEARLAGFSLTCSPMILQRALHGFLPNMKLETVDKWDLWLICVATIIDVDGQRVKVCLHLLQ